MHDSEYYYGMVLDSNRKIDVFTQLRGVAIVFIVVYHYVLDIFYLRVLPHEGSFSDNLSLLSVFPPQGFLNGLGTLLSVVFASGWHYVGIFIILSGFGLTYSRIQRAGRQDNFLKSRLTKIVPAWHLAVLVSLIVNFFGGRYFYSYLLHHPLVTQYSYVYLLLFPLVIDFEYRYISPINISLWFIVLIVQFYIIFDILYYFLKVWGWRKFLGVCLIVTIGFRFFIEYFLLQRPNSIVSIDARDLTLFNTAPARLFEFAFGMVLAGVISRNGLRFVSRLGVKTLCGGLGLWAVGVVFTWSLFGWGVSDIFLSVGLFVFWLTILSGNTSQLFTRWTVALGEISFYIFLFHQPVVTQFLGPLTRMLSMGGDISSLIFVLFIFIIIVALTAIALLRSHFSNSLTTTG